MASKAQRAAQRREEERLLEEERTMRRRLVFIGLGALATVAVVVAIFVSTIRASDSVPAPSVSPSAVQSASPVR